ncbi:ATP-binding protein, partial [Sulfitobacter sp. M22386]
QAERDLVEARDRALAGEKAKTDFLATMSHEIRTPLNGLLGNLTLLQDTKLTARQNRYVKNMETSGKLLMSHISDVLDITKYDAGKLVLRPVPMSLSDLLRDIVDNQSGAALANNTTLTWGWSGPSVDWILSDRERLQHILINIIGNAVKFTVDGQVSIEAEVQETETGEPLLQIIVSDTGIGMDPALQRQIFDDFMTGDSSYDRNVGGTGLGLGIAQRFAKALGGTITVESEKDVGSSFAISLPITPIASPATETPSKSREHNDISVDILLVEDNEINRSVAREMLQAVGHKVTEAHNGQIAVDLAKTHRFDLILMDISMPVMDGRHATREIRAGGACANSPIIALTANAMPEEQEAFLQDGMNEVLTKPLNRSAMIDMISALAQSEEHSTSVQQETATLVSKAYLDDLRDTLGEAAVEKLLLRYVSEMECVFRSIRPLIPTTCAHLFRGIRPLVTRCREAVDFGYQV